MLVDSAEFRSTSRMMGKLLLSDNLEAPLQHAGGRIGHQRMSATQVLIRISPASRALERKEKGLITLHDIAGEANFSLAAVYGS